MDLFYLNGEQSGESCPLTPPGICIGRESDNDLQLLVDGVSRYHAKISFDGKDWYIEDLGSTNGTFTDTQQISGKVKLSPGTEITIGSQQFRFGDPLEPKTVENVQTAAAKTAAFEKVDMNEESSDLASEIRKSRFSIFNGNPHSGNEGQGKPKKSKLGNLIFTLIIITLPLVCICVYMMVNDHFKKKNENAKIEQLPQPFALYYEKKIITSDNVFRFEARIEDNIAILTVDDLKYGRHYVVKKNEIKKEEIDKLKDSIRKTVFMKTENKINTSASGSEDEYLHLSIFIDGGFHSVTVQNTDAPTSFKDIESAIADFSREYNVKTGIYTAEEMRKEADQYFKEAEDLFNNYLANLQNLRKAIKKYQNAKELYEQFEPKPKNWNDCRKRLEEAEKTYKDLFASLHYNIQRHNKLKEYDAASQHCSKMLELLDPQSEEYEKYHGYKVQFDRNTKLKKKK